MKLWRFRLKGEDGHKKRAKVKCLSFMNLKSQGGNDFIRFIDASKVSP